MNIKASPQCEQCNFPIETTIDMLYECLAVLNWWNFKGSGNTNPSAAEILYGYKLESTSFYTFNHHLLITRYCIYLARNKSKTPKLEVFIVLLETKIQCERELTIKNGNLIKYRKKWTSLSISDTCCDS